MEMYLNFMCCDTPAEKHSMTIDIGKRKIMENLKSERCKAEAAVFACV
jgi:hypothetical protein